jgi:ketosteroid isomerase-like protein
MSRENVELVRDAAEAFNRRDLDAWVAHFDPDIVWHAFPDEPDPGPFHGHDAVRAMATRWTDVLSDFRLEAKEFIDADEYVLMPARMLGRIRDSDAEVTVHEVYVNKCRNGKIAEVRECRTKEEALEAAGLQE